MMADELSSLRQTKVAISVGGEEEGEGGERASVLALFPRVPFRRGWTAPVSPIIR